MFLTNVRSFAMILILAVVIFMWARILLGLISYYNKNILSSVGVNLDSFIAKMGLDTSYTKGFHKRYFPFVVTTLIYTLYLNYLPYSAMAVLVSSVVAIIVLFLQVAYDQMVLKRNHVFLEKFVNVLLIVSIFTNLSVSTYSLIFQN